MCPALNFCSCETRFEGPQTYFSSPLSPAIGDTPGPVLAKTAVVWSHADTLMLLYLPQSGSQTELVQLAVLPSLPPAVASGAQESERPLRDRRPLLLPLH